MHVGKQRDTASTTPPLNAADTNCGWLLLFFFFSNYDVICTTCQLLRILQVISSFREQPCNIFEADFVCTLSYFLVMSTMSLGSSVITHHSTVTHMTLQNQNQLIWTSQDTPRRKPQHHVWNNLFLKRLKVHKLKKKNTMGWLIKNHISGQRHPILFFLNSGL